MSVLTILLILFGIFAFAIFFKLIKNVFKALFYVISLFVVLLLIVGIITMVDANNFKKNYQEGTTKFLLQDEGNVLAGLVLNGSTAEIIPVDAAQLAEDQEALADDDLAAVKGDHYKLFLMDMTSLDTANQSISVDGLDITTAQAKGILVSADPLDEVAALIAEQQGISKDLVRQQLEQQGINDAAIKADLFGFFLANLFPQRLTYMVQQIKEGNIVIYKETMLFKVLKKLPASLVDKAAAKLQVPEVEP